MCKHNLFDKYLIWIFSLFSSNTYIVVPISYISIKPNIKLYWKGSQKATL